MKTKTIQLFQLDELPIEARKKVIKKHSDINVNHEWWDFVYDDFEALALTLGVSVDLKKTYFTGFYQQGQGSAFTADINIHALCEGVKHELWKEYAPKEGFKFHPATKNIERVLTLIKAGYIDFMADVEISNRETSIRVNCDYTIEAQHDYSRIDQACSELSDLIEDVCKTLNNWFFDQLRDNSDYLQSEQAIIDTLKANEYWFDLSGNIETPDFKPTLIERIKALLVTLRRWFTPKFFRLTALSIMLGQMLGALIYSAIQHPVLKPFFER